MLIIVQRCYQVVMLMMLLDLLLKWLLSAKGQTNLPRQLIDDFGIHPRIVVLTGSSLPFDHWNPLALFNNREVRLRCIVGVGWNAMLSDPHFLLLMISAPSLRTLHRSKWIAGWRSVDLVWSHGRFIHQWVSMHLLLVVPAAHKHLCALISRLHVLLVRYRYTT